MPLQERIIKRDCKAVLAPGDVKKRVNRFTGNHTGAKTT